MTSEHLLQHCPLQDILRKTTWPEDLPLTEKLYGDLAALGSGSICEGSWCFRLAVVIEEEEVYILSVERLSCTYCRVKRWAAFVKITGYFWATCRPMYTVGSFVGRLSCVLKNNLGANSCVL